jgi:hypothetical protein
MEFPCFTQEIQSDNRNSTEPIGGFDRPLKLTRGTNLLKLLISSRGPSKPTDRFRRIPTVGSHRIPTLGIWMSVDNLESDRILSAGWIRSDSLSDSLTWVYPGRTVRPGNDRFRVIPVILWKQYSDRNFFGFFPMISGQFLLESTGKIWTISSRNTASMFQCFLAGSSGLNLRPG